MALAVISLKWVHREIHGKPPSPRQGHSACLVGNVAYIFGGIRSVDWPKRGTYFFRDLYQLHLYKRMQWEKVKQKGEIPKGRYGHHMCVIGHKIYLFGGKHELHADRCLSGLHVYDTEKKTWSQPQTSGTEPVAHGSTSSVVGNRIYVYGGLVDGQAVDDLHCFDSENQWWVKLTIQGVPPSPRCDSASTSVGNEIFVFGGTGGTDQWFNDIHVFNTKKLLWKELNKTDGEPPTPRGSHCFLAHVDKDIYMFGGSNDSNTSHPTLGDLYKFSLDKRKWKRPFYGGCPPAKRSGHAAIIHRNKLIIIGGSNEDTDFNDVHIAKLINPSKRQPLKVPAGDMHDFLDTLNNSDPRPMVADGEDADAHFYEKEEDPETISKEEEPAGGSEMEQSNGQHQTESPVTGSRDGSVAGSDGDLKGSPGKSVHFEDDGEGKQDGASLSSSAGSLASSAGSLSSASSSSASSSGSGGSDEPGSSNNNNSNNNNAGDSRRGTSSGVRSRTVPEDGAMTPDGGSEYVKRSNSDKRGNKGKVEAAAESNGQMVSGNEQVGGPVRSAGQGKPKLAPIAKTEPKPSTKKEGKKAGSQKKKPKKERSDGGLEDDTQTPVPAERRSYPPVDSHLDSHQHRASEEAAWNHLPGDLRNLNQIHAQAHEPPQDEPESDEEESESEGGSGSGSGSSSEEESDNNDDDDGESEDGDDGEDNQSVAPKEQSINGNDESLAYRPASQERLGESSKDEAESENDDGSGSDDDDDDNDDDDDDDDDDDSGSDGEEESADGSGSESESGSGSGSEDGSDSEED